MDHQKAMPFATENSESDVDEEKIVLHVYDDESKEFTSLTTYHGMIRIYTSETWPSRIFWGVVVVTCVFLFMIQGGVLLQFYQTCPTATKTVESLLLPMHLPFITICPYGFLNQQSLFELVTRGNIRDPVPEKHLNLSSRRIVDMYSFSCQDVIDKVKIGRHRLFDFCRASLTQMTERGKCFTFGKWREIGSKMFSITFKEKYANTFTLHVHEDFETSLKANDYFWLDPRKQSSLAIEIEHASRYSLQNGELCSQTTHEQSKKSCIQNCLVDNFVLSCQCSPFFDKSSSSSCSLSQLKACKKVIQTYCNCPSKCSLSTPVIKLTRSIHNKNRRTSLSFASSLHNLKSHQQYKRFRQIDLMSYVGGVMGLFLGMSCITLLEVFIYIIKTIVGALNDARHQQFSEISAPSTNDYRCSHEQIIITQKKEKSKTTSANKTEDIPSFNKNLNSRRASTFSIFANLQSDMKMQFPRTDLILRKKSVYLGTCDF